MSCESWSGKALAELTGRPHQVDARARVDDLDRPPAEPLVEAPRVDVLPADRQVAGRRADGRHRGEERAHQLPAMARPAVDGEQVDVQVRRMRRELRPQPAL